MALTGPSGSGKSSLLMVAAGLERPSGGRVAVAGTDITRMGEDAAARFRRGRVGIVFQSFHLIPTMTALENVAVPLELMGVGDAWDRAAAELQAVGLGDRAPIIIPGNCRAASSSAWRWRARWRRGRRSCSPTSRPAISTAPLAQAIADLLFALNAERGATLFLVTHEESLARRCQRMVRLAKRPDRRRRNRPRCRMTGIALALRLARRELRGGFAGLSHLLPLPAAGHRRHRGRGIAERRLPHRACAIQGQTFLGGDVAVDLVHRPATRARNTPFSTR